MGACRSTDGLPAVRWRSAHFEYAARADDGEACADITAVLERHWDFWHPRLSSAAAPIEYFKFRDSEDLRQKGGCPYGGCTNGTRVRSTRTFDAHELIHAYLGADSVAPAPLFAEGAAVAFSCDWDGLPAPAVIPDWRELLDPRPGSPQFLFLYPLAGQLVSHLVATHGLERFVPFYRSIAGEIPADVVASKFLAAFGVALDEVWPQATPAEKPICLGLWECSQPAIVLDGNPTSVALTCGQDLVPSTLRLPRATNLAGWFRNAPVNPSIVAGRCGDSPATGLASLWPGGSFHLQASLPAGTYVARFGGAELSLTASPSPSVGASCADLTAGAVTASDLPLLVIAPGQGVQHARLTFDQPVVATIPPSSPSTTVWMCDDCAADPGTCPSVTNETASRPTLEGAWTIKTDGPWAVIRLDHQ